MSYEIVFTRRADRDLEEAAAWYEKQKDFLSWELRENVISAIEKISDDRVEYQIFSGDIRMIRLSRFPFKLYYLKDQGARQIIVLALFHFKKNPDEISGLLK